MMLDYLLAAALAILTIYLGLRGRRQPRRVPLHNVQETKGSQEREEVVRRIAFLIWDGPLHDTFKGSNDYLWDKTLDTARSILAALEKYRV